MNVEQVVLRVLEDINIEKCTGNSAKSFKIVNLIKVQSSELQTIVNDDAVKKAGDQGYTVGYATNESSECLPLPVVFAHKIIKLHHKISSTQTGAFLKNDCKALVVMQYTDKDGDLTPDRVHTVTFSSLHDENISLEMVKNKLVEIIKKVICQCFFHYVSHLNY